VLNASLEQLQSERGLDKAVSIQTAVKEKHSLEVTIEYVRSVLRNDIGAKYKRVKKIPYLGNTDRCLLLRQHYAKFIIAQLANGVRVINVDQTWLNNLNFKRQKWRL